MVTLSSQAAPSFALQPLQLPANIHASYAATPEQFRAFGLSEYITYEDAARLLPDGLITHASLSVDGRWFR
jgi:hypothetical protein